MPASSVVSDSSREVIATFMQHVIVEYRQFGGEHRRAEPRESIAIPVSVQELSPALEPIAEKFTAITRDLSLGGIAIFHRSPIESGTNLQFTISVPTGHEHFTLWAAVEHCTPCGEFYIIGCRFASGESSDDTMA